MCHKVNPVGDLEIRRKTLSCFLTQLQLTWASVQAKLSAQKERLRASQPESVRVHRLLLHLKMHKSKHNCFRKLNYVLPREKSPSKYNLCASKIYISVLKISYCSFTNLPQISRHKYETCQWMGGQRVEMHIKHEYCFCYYYCTLCLCYFYWMMIFETSLHWNNCISLRNVSWLNWLIEWYGYSILLVEVYDYNLALR